MSSPVSSTTKGASRTIQEWAKKYLLSSDLGIKCNPEPPPSIWAQDESAQDLRPGRPPELKAATKKPRSFKLASLQTVEAKAALHHKLWHHELQAAELMCWAILRFVNAPLAFRKGLLGIFHDEVRHMALYQEQIEAWGYHLGDYPIRDWFWERVPTCETPLEFVSLLGMGLEAANLDHTERFSSWFRSLGESRCAEIQDQIGEEEIEHVRFATHWFRKWTGDIQFQTWCEQLPPPLTPLLMRGKTLHLQRRGQALFPQEFLDNLKEWKAEPTSRRIRRPK